MENFASQSRIVVTCNKRLSPYLTEEIQKLGFHVELTSPSYVELQGTLTDCIRLNLQLRCASQVLYSMRQFTADSVDELYQKLTAISWESVIKADGYFSVTSNAEHPSVNNTMFVNVKVKDAIVDRIRQKTGKRPDTGPSQSKALIHLFWRDRQAEVFIDTSGETLSKHGYRIHPGKAPMLEALASATIMAGKWDRRSPFVNPMCGSGTLAIEAALLATNRFPGLYRNNYAFMHLIGYNVDVYQAALDDVRKQVTEVEGLKVIATDLRRDAVSLARDNARLAGVEQYIRFDACDFEKTPVPPANGVIFFNPEYGERMGDIQKLELTYGRIGDFLKRKCTGYTGYIFTGNLDLAKKIGLRASRRIEFYSAKIDCRLLEYDLYEGSRKKTD